MRYTLKHFSFVSLAILVLGIGMVQAQTPGAPTNTSNRRRFDASEFQFSNLAAKARTTGRSGFALMPAGRNVSANASAFTLTPMAAGNLQVLGSGSLGRLTKWTGLTSSNSFIGDSSIFEDKYGLVGIGTDSPTSKLTVMGLIESAGGGGGFKFADGTIQTTAGFSSIFHDGTLMGNGTSGSPLGIAPGGVGTTHLANNSVTGAKIANGTVVRSLNGLFDNVTLAAGSNITITPSGNTLTIASIGGGGGLTSVATNSTLAGNGTSGSPLGIALPLNLTGAESVAYPFSLVNIENTSPGGNGVSAFGGSSTSATSGGDGVLAIGGSNTFGSGGGGIGRGGLGIVSSGGKSDKGPGGQGVRATGGSSSSDLGGAGVEARGGFSDSFQGGLGVQAIGGASVSGVGGFGADIRGGNTTSGLGGVGMVVVPGTGPLGTGAAAIFEGAVTVLGDLNVAGTKNFKIDHPLDPENKYLIHAAIESSEVLNVYSGNVTTDPNGKASVVLPEWFESVNKDLRYQLTVIGTFAQAIVGEKVKDNRFIIKTNAPNVEVSWQVTGVRSDAAMRKHPFKVEQDKTETERGFYLSPDAFGQPEEKGVDWARQHEMLTQTKEQRETAKQTRAQQ